MRLDRFLCEAGIGSRSEVKKEIRAGYVTVNEKIEKSADCQVSVEDKILLRGQSCVLEPFFYLMMNKEAGFVTAISDTRQPTVMDPLKITAEAQGIRLRDIAPVGRLDKDSEGLLLFTNDGQLVHKLLSPKYHVQKCYLVHLRTPLTKEAITRLENGVEIGDEHPTLPACVELLSDTQMKLTICEGRFHQVKRMVAAVGSEVVYLRRVSFGPIPLDETLKPSATRRLTVSEIESLRMCVTDIERNTAKEKRSTNNVAG
ncbi:MAG: rRNA pseudouridine synthase [Lachnospiraceae bacterium]|jgi:16S rRNA pseudouridine516 synthase|nr:rRNA pseudouridine synthase [Lachnospiraceae bacterium]